GIVRCLVDGGKSSHPNDGNGIEEGLGGQLELQLCRERHDVAIIAHVEIGDEAENALLLLDLDLLGGDLLEGSNRRSHGYCGERLGDTELADRQDCVLAGLEHDGGGCSGYKD